ncbi:lipopolysaccharide biosynthesis protein [Acinetobacter johnsonii]|uniref:lipopolysaccharide biosynthesis protein n=1 Tax=Acinetobacter johnsonii TaxID=40214 RepID=UPI0032B5D284
MKNMKVVKYNSNLIKILSNYVGKLWGLLAVFICVPFYIKFLGVESYAVIGFYTLVVALISFADAGMSSAITREFALDEKNYYKKFILYRIEKFYWLILLLISIFIIYFSDLIAQSWLKVEGINIIDLKNYIILIALGASIHMASSLYYGALFGLGEQVKANNYQIIWTTFKSLFVIFILQYYSSLYLFFIWQIVCNFIYVAILRFEVLKNLNVDKIIFKDKLVFPDRIYKYIGGMALVAIISSISSQLDKIVISYFYSLKLFGYYSMISLLAQIPIFVTMPIASFIFPLLSKFSDNKNENKMFDITFEKFIFLLYLAIIPISIFICFYPLEILHTWSRVEFDSIVSNDLIFLVQSLTLGSLFLAMQFPFYYSLLANSETKYTVYQGIVQLIIGIPLLLFIAKFYPLKYMGISWLIINICGFIYLLILCTGRYVNQTNTQLLIKYIFPNFILSILLGCFGYFFYVKFSIPYFFIVLINVLIVFLSIIVWNNKMESRRIFSFKHIYDFPKG